MKSNSTVSVIIPTHNRCNQLHRAVKSVLNQSYKNYEIIIIDDCSTDKTVDSINILKKNYPFLIRSYSFSKPMGAGCARQKGIEISVGRYIGFLDDDDEWLPNKLALQVGALENNQEIGAVTCWYYRYIAGKYIKVKLPEDIEPNDIFWSNFLGSFSFSLVRRKIVDNRIIMNPELLSCQDWDYWINILQYSSVGVVTDYLVNYDDNQGNRITLNYRNKLNGLTNIIKLYQTKMNDNQIKFINAKIERVIANDKSYNIISRLKKQLSSSIVLQKLGHPDYQLKIHIIFQLIKVMLPNIIKKYVVIFIRIFYKNEQNTIIHNSKDLVVAKSNNLKSFDKIELFKNIKIYFISSLS